MLVFKNHRYCQINKTKNKHLIHLNITIAMSQSDDLINKIVLWLSKQSFK